MLSCETARTIALFEVELLISMPLETKAYARQEAGTYCRLMALARPNSRLMLPAESEACALRVTWLLAKSCLRVATQD